MKLPRSTSAIQTPSYGGVTASMERAQQQNIQLAQTAAGIITDVVNERNDEQQNAAFAKANGTMHSYDESHAGKEFYTGGEIPEGTGIPTTEVVIDADGNEVEQMRSRIPAYEVQAQMRNKQQRLAIDSAAKDIQSPSRRKQFVRQMTERADRQNIKMLQNQTQKQNDQIRSSQDQDLERALLNRDYESASYVANNYSGSDEDRRARTKQVAYFQETDTYNDAMSEENTTAIDNSINKLEADGYAGEMNEVQRLATLAQLRSKKGQVQEKRSGAATGRATVLGIEMDRTTKALENGEYVAPAAISRLTQQYNAGVGAGIIDPSQATWTRRVFEFDEMNSVYPELSKFRGMDNASRDDYVRQLEVASQTGSDQYKVDLFKTANKKAKQALKNDPLGFSMNQGIVDVQAIDTSSMGSLAKGLRDRQQAAVSIDSRFGKSTQTGLFTNDEAAELVEWLDGASHEEQMQLMSTVIGSVPDNADKVWAQLAGNDGGTYAVMGDLLQDNQVKTVRNLLQGRSAVKNTPEVAGKWKTDFQPVVMDNMGNAYASSPETRAAVTENIKYAYAGLASRDGDFSGEYNPDRLKKAINQVTGGLVKIGNSTVPLPQRGMHPDVFDSWLRDISPEYFAAKGGVSGYNSKSGGRALKDRIRSGMITMQAVGKGQYALFDEGGYDTGKKDSNGDPVIGGSGYLSRDDDGQMYILEYDENADQQSRWESGMQEIQEWWDE